MNRLSQSYRVKVFVDGHWVSTGDFRDLQQAEQRARWLSLHLDRHVEIRGANDRPAADSGVSLIGEDSPCPLFDDNSLSDTILLD